MGARFYRPTPTKIKNRTGVIMDQIAINRKNFTKFTRLISAYAALNENLYNLIEVFDVREIKPKDEEMFFKGFFMRNRTTSIAIRRIANDVNDYRMRRLPAFGYQSTFARRVFEDLIWCAAFLDAGEEWANKGEKQ